MSRSRPAGPRPSSAKALRKKPASRRKAPARKAPPPPRLAQRLLQHFQVFRAALPRDARHWLSHLRAWLAVTGLIGLAACETTGTAPNQAALPPPGNLILEPASFEALPGWGSDRLSEAWPALLKSCGAIGQLPADQPLGPDGLAGTPADWRPACAQARQLPASDETVLRRFLEASFRPFLARDSNGRPGLFTSYYEPEIAGSLTPGGPYKVPLYRVPPDPERYSREAIDAGILAGRHLELIWLTDPVDAFILQIQGSGRIRLPDGRIQRVGYAGNNGQTFVGITRMMMNAGLIDRADAQTTAAWLKAHPAEATGWMHQNPRYIFFRLINGEGPIGAESLALTPGRSLAVDTRFLALGLPLWLDTTWPVDLGNARKGEPLRRLMVAQDVGNAIKGPVRGDIFWGSGEPALTFAGSMKNSGSYYVFLPVSVASRRLPVISDAATP